MSYLGFPRLHFSGRFQADPSTVNNDPEHFDDARFRARYQEPGRGATNGWWNPGGTGAWRLRDCRVTQVFYADGSRGGDPVVGGVLLSNDDRASAKIVDLDPEQQMVSTIFGLRLKLLSGDGSVVFAGEFVPAPFADIWIRFPTGGPDSYYGAAYQSVIESVAWAQDVDSPFVQELRAASADGVLSIKFNVDGFDDDSASPTFTWGRVVGTVGPYLAGEPQQFLAERVMTPAPGSSLNNAPFAVDRAGGRLLIDLGNSLPTTSPGGPLADLGVLQITCRVHDGMALVGNVDTTSNAFNDTDAGIASVRLAPGSVDSVMSSPVSVLDRAGNVLLAEPPDGRYVRADGVVFRMYPVAPDNAAADHRLCHDVRNPDARRTNQGVDGRLRAARPGQAGTRLRAARQRPCRRADLSRERRDRPGRDRAADVHRRLPGQPARLHRRAGVRRRVWLGRCDQRRSRPQLPRLGRVPGARVADLGR